MSQGPKHSDRLPRQVPEGWGVGVGWSEKKKHVKDQMPTTKQDLRERHTVKATFHHLEAAEEEVQVSLWM